MRVLAVLPNYPPDSLVGSWLTTAVFLEDLRGRGHDVEVVRYLGNNRRSYTHRDIPVTVSIGLIPDMVAGADVVISHLGDNQRAARACAAAGVPNVRMAHGHGVTHERMLGAALVVFNSSTFAERVGWDGPQIVAHPPVIPDRYLTTPGTAVTLINLSEDKGVRTFWRCAEQLPHLEFLGVRGGYGHQKHECGRCPNIEVIPSVTDMRRIYSRTRVLLMPSRHETYGRVGVEAAVSGIPTIAHPTPGLREALGDAGIFVDRADTAGWVAQLRRLEDPDEWAAASAAAKASVPTPDLDVFAAAIEALVGVPA